MDEDSDEPLPTAAPRPPTGTAPSPPTSGPREETREERFERFEKREQKLAYVLTVVVAVLAIVYGGRPFLSWVSDTFFEDPLSAATKAAKCYNDVDAHLGRSKAECDELASHANALLKRGQAEQFCKDKGLKFKGTIGDQVECEP